MLAAMPGPGDRGDRAAILGGVLAMLLFSGNFVCTRHGLQNGLSVADLVLVRYAVSGAVFLALLLRIGMGGLSVGRGLVLTGLAGAPYFLLTALALQFAPAMHASILNPGGTMVFAPLLGWLVLGAKPGTGVRIGLPILAAGLLMIGGTGLLEGGGGGLVWLGDLLLLLSGFTWALYGVLMRLWGVTGLRAACVIGAFSLGWAPLHLAIFGLGGIPEAPGEVAIQALYQGLIAGGLAIILYSRAVAAMGPARGALLPPLVPALGTLWAWLLLGEQVTAVQLAGMATVIAGMLTGALWRSRETDETSPRRR
jgi:drug/metabolite transporter (DMT)-like permease